MVNQRRRHATGERVQQILQRVWRSIGAGINGRLVGIQGECIGPRIILLPTGKERLDAATVQAAVNPAVSGAELKARVIGILFDFTDHVHDLADICAVHVNRHGLGSGLVTHGMSPAAFCWV